MEHFLASVPGIISGIMIAALGWLAGKVGEARRGRKEESAQIAKLTKEIHEIKEDLEEDKPKKEALYKGVKAELRESLVNAYGEYVSGGAPLTVERLHEITEGYEAYAVLGGNGTGKKMYEGICKVPLEIVN